MFVISFLDFENIHVIAAFFLLSNESGWMKCWSSGAAKFTFGNSWLGWSSTGDNAFVACSPAVDMNPKRGNWHCCHHYLANRNQVHLVKMIDIGLGICLLSLVHRNWNTAMFALDDNMENSFPYLQHPTDFPVIPGWNETVFFFIH